MSSPLYELTREDWNRLFPIHLEEHNPEWKEIFRNEKELILSQISELRPQLIEHVGSTSIPGIMAKPYIDMLIVVDSEWMFSQELIDRMGKVGYTYFLVPAHEEIESYMSFGKGYNLEGQPEQIFHIHLCPSDNFMVNQLKFRDRLRADLALAKDYEKLKKSAAITFQNDRGGYRNSKTTFIREVLASME